MLLIAYGTRPEFIKIKPIIDQIKGKVEFKTVFTGQHKDIIDSTYTPDYQLEIEDGSNRLDSVLQSGLNNDHIFEGISHILVQGDTTSVLSLALAAYHRKVKIIHLEAGLRTYDFENPYPEEANRQLVSRIADFHLCPTEWNKDNLVEEGCKGKKFVVGNTVLDNLVPYKDRCVYGNKVLITLHRRENHDIIDQFFTELSQIAEQHSDLEFIIPLHPNPNVQKHKHLLKNIKVIDPLPHSELLELLIQCRFVISDSGGLQEECSFLNKKVIVCREETERPESLMIHSFLVPVPKNLKILVNKFKDDYKVNEPCPYGDGHSAERISKILVDLLDRQN